ncbi:MAG: hypothetical protein ACLT8U_00430 [Faecalibacterium sp.]
MNPMYDLALDGYGPPLEPPDNYYFLPREQEAEQKDPENDE